MAPLFRLKTYLLVFHFYKIILLTSTLIAIILLFFKAQFFTVVLIKLGFVLFFLLKFHGSRNSKDLILFQNFGISKTCLLSLAFTIDLTISSIIYLIFFS
ncbi:hypothetical protein SAMN05216294_1666 [Flagellimonas zhangzhouensis]|uniref:Uncharacterized protein n=1 Tax=Flagellimonas zhangzhouensis TaxID=1073328 RepID=A0A1H2QRZ1_9FLAO|nr:hypothetical protein SAMN05216294_1666 [Allomuricauda zhangzhouensis]SDW09209.1 hypothetical protein SAMN04487892_0318 [Allomuricauda zhangzhouensis]